MKIDREFVKKISHLKDNLIHIYKDGEISKENLQSLNFLVSKIESLMGEVSKIKNKKEKKRRESYLSNEIILLNYNLAQFGK